MELIERILKERLHYLNCLTFQEFKKYSKTCNNYEERIIQCQNLMSYCKNLIKAKGEKYSFICIH